MDTYGEQTVEMLSTSVLSLVMDNGKVFLEDFARLMVDKRECMELMQEEMSIRETLTEVAAGVTSPADI